jgi:hypothetical protein
LVAADPYDELALLVQQMAAITGKLLQVEDPVPPPAEDIGGRVAYVAEALVRYRAATKELHQLLDAAFDRVLAP